MSDFLDLQGAKDLNTDAIHIGAVANSKDPVTGAPIDTHVNRAGGTDYTLHGFWNALGPVVMPWTSVVGGTLTQPNQAFLHPANGNYYSWTGAYPAGGHVVAPGTDPTVVAGYVPRTDVVFRAEITPSVTEALRRSYAEAGYNLVDGSFEEGGTLTSSSDVLLHKATVAAYAWSGVFPKVVSAGTTPSTSGGIGVGAWVDRTDVTLRGEMTSGPITSRGSGLSLRDFISVKDFGAKGDGVADDYSAFNFACTDYNDIRISTGTYVIGQRKLGEYQKPLNIVGEGADVIIRVGSDNVDKKVFRVGAVGGPHGGYTQPRAVTKFENLSFKTPTGILAPWAYTGIDVAATFPIVMKDITMLSMGPDSVKLTSCYYGYIQGFSLVNSGLTLNNVNNIEFSGGDVRPSDITDDPTGGGLLFGDVAKFPIQMEESDLIKFTSTAIEGWKVPAILLRRCYTTVFNDSWFEGNASISHIIKTEQAQTIEFNSCQLDFAIPYTGSFIEVNNQIPDADQNRFWTMFVRINGGYLLTTSIPFGDAKEFVKVTAGEEVRVLIDGVTFRGGPLYADKSVQFDVRSILLTSESKHNFYSLPNAPLLPAYNRWMPQSVSSDWDFATGANFTATAGLVVATTTANGEYMTGTRGVKVSNIANDSAEKTISRITTGQMGPVTVEGQSYYVFVRLKCDQEVVLRCEINGGFLDFAQTPTDNRLVPNTWRDYVFKTDAAKTWAQGRFYDPTIKIYVTNPAANTSPANLYIDRIDYSIVRGDVQI